jgi:IclR family transcriptional regulator, pca regulon regulatory protein
MMRSPWTGGARAVQVDTQEEAMPRDADGPYVQALVRGLAVLRCFTADDAELSISDVSRLVGIDRAAARRFLHTLTTLGYLGHSAGAFHLRPRVLELARPFLDSITELDVLQQHLEELTAEIGETSMAFVWDQDESVFLAGVQARRLVSVQVTTGTRVAAYCSPPGRVLLASLSPQELDAYFESVELTALTPHTVTDEQELRQVLERVAERGYSVGDQELALGLRTVAVPVRDAGGHVVYAVSVGVTAATVTMTELKGRIRERLRRTADEIERDLALLG